MDIACSRALIIEAQKSREYRVTLGLCSQSNVHIVSCMYPSASLGHTKCSRLPLVPLVVQVNIGHCPLLLGPWGQPQLQPQRSPVKELRPTSLDSLTLTLSLSTNGIHRGSRRATAGYCARPVSRGDQGSLAHFKASASPLSRGPLRDVRRAAFGLNEVWIRNALTDARRACAAIKLLDSGARSDSCCWGSLLLPDTCVVRRRSKDDSRDSDDATQVDSPSLLRASSFELRASSFRL